MATFPGGVKVFTNKTDGVSVNAAADINDLQNEVNAIEDGYLNGSARLNSSNSTCVNLSVTGGSTLATLNVTGVSTFTTLSVTGGSTWAVRSVEPPPHMALVYRESSYAAGSSVNSTIAWNAQGILTNSSMHSTGTNPERITPQSTGVYQFSAQAVVAVPATVATIRLEVVDSSGAIVALNDEVGVSTANALCAIQCVGYKRFDALGGYATMVFVNASNNSTFSLSSGIGLTWFSGLKL